jgi:glycosyltransferase involved in cell wall biosynthesis
MARIGVNALYLIPGGVGGTEIYLCGLLAALADIDPVNEYFVFTNRETGADLVPKSRNFNLAPQSVRAAWRPGRLLWEQTVLPVEVRRLRLDVLLNPGFTAPLLAPCPQVTVFHDLQHLRHPEYFRWWDLPFWKFFLFWSAQVSKLVLAGSAATASDLFRYYRLPQSKVRIAPLGVDPQFFDLAPQRAPERFVLTVSTLHPHKNLDGLLRAFAAFHEEQPDLRLIVCGLHGHSTAPLLQLRDTLGLRGAVEFPGWIPREDVYDLYRRAWAFIYPSKFEGFGIPVVEAMAAGVPTACSDIEPMSGHAGGAALGFDPGDAQSLLDALRRICQDDGLRRRLSTAGPLQAQGFSWTITARITLDALSGAIRV